MFCPWCGTYNQEGVNYCSICGKEIKSIPPLRKDTSKMENTINILENAVLLFFLSSIGYGLEAIGLVQTLKLFLSYGFFEISNHGGLLYTILIVSGYILVYFSKRVLNKSPDNQFLNAAYLLGGIIGIIIGVLSYFS